MQKQKQKVFIPSKTDEGFDSIISDQNGKQMCGANEVEGYFFTEEEWQELQTCRCTPDETTGWTTVKCCNICGKPVEDFWRVGNNSEPVVICKVDEVQNFKI